LICSTKPVENIHQAKEKSIDDAKGQRRLAGVDLPSFMQKGVRMESLPQ
jgi:hypothetical protein